MQRNLFFVTSYCLAFNYIALLVFASQAIAHSRLTPEVPIYPGYTLRINEQFNGSKINPELWTWGDGTFQENLCTFDKDGIKIADGMMTLSIEKVAVPAHYSYSESDDKGPQWVESKDYRCGELQSKDVYRYGILEVRMKTPRAEDNSKNSGFVGSMFTFRQPKWTLWEEIDYEVQGQYDERFTSNLIYGKGCGDWWCTRQWGSWEGHSDRQGTHTPEANSSLKTAEDYSHSAGFHTIRIVWHPEYIQWYLDGVKYRELKQTSITQIPATDGYIGINNNKTKIPEGYAKLMFNFWITNTGKAFGGINQGNEYPMHAQYDWFRYYSLDGYDQPYKKRPKAPFDYGYTRSDKQ